MNLTPREIRVTGMARHILISLFLTIASSAAHAATVAPPEQSLKATQEAWRAAMVQAHRNEPGCFEAKYPSKKWQSVPCGSEEPGPNVKAPRPFRPLDENSTGNQTALSSGSITSATGTFTAIANVTQAAGFGNTNNFTIQMNTNGFVSPFCKASHNTACIGSEQFVVDSGGSTNIQTWLVNYLDSVTVNCPDKTWAVSGPSCWKRAVTSTTKTGLPVHIFNQLQGITLTGTTAANGQDTFFVSVAGKTISQITLPANLSFGLARQWKLVDFNVYGESNNEVIFNPGAVIGVVVSVTDGAPNPPTCSKQGLGGVVTVETSNLTLGPCQSFAGVGLLPHGITFMEGVPATVQSVSPSTGPNSGGTAVTITGTGLSNKLAVKFGGTYATGLTNCNGSTVCTVISPPGADMVGITVANLGDGGGDGIFSSDTSSDKFTYYVPLTSCKLSEFDCPSGGGQQNYTVACSATVDFSLNGHFQKEGTSFTGQEVAARQASVISACAPNSTNCQSFTTTSTETCPITPINPGPPAPPIKNCQICIQTGRQCVKVAGGFQCKGTSQ